MKTKFALIKSLGGYLRLGAAVGTALLSCGLPLHARAASGSPVGIWDVVISGNRQGLAQMQFFDGGTPATRTFNIYEIVVPNRPSSSSSSNTGDRGGPVTRNDTGSPPPVTTTITNLFGEESVLNSRWGFDVNGNLIGTYGEALAEVCTPVTETVVTTIVTNSTTIYITNTITITNCVGITNGVDFTGTAVSNKSLTLRGFAFGRPVVFSGLPVLTLTNIQGSYIGTRVAGGVSSFEFLTLSSAVGPFNLYDVTGSSGGYSYMTPGGHALLSRRGKIAFAIPLDPAGNIVRATVGGFDLRRLRFNTGGVEQSDGQTNNFIRFTGAP